ncbi:MAG: hypothetical protein RLZZ502_682 [Pseudomonadota bacterium]
MNAPTSSQLPPTQKRALLTGGEGFTGRYLQAALKQLGVDCCCLRANLLDGAAVVDELKGQRFDWVFHLAAIANVAHGQVDEIYQVNVLGTRHLLEGLLGLQHKPASVVLASSANVYGNNPAELHSETLALEPTNDYAVSKLAMEYLARTWFARLPICLVRPFNYTGVGQTEQFLIPKIVGHFVRRASVIELGNVDVWRDFSDVRDVVLAYTALAQAGVHSQVVNICSGQLRSLREVFDLCQTITGQDMSIRVNPQFVRATEVVRLRGDDSRLRALMPQRRITPIADTLRWMLTHRPDTAS